ncbi:MAG: biotin/lipoyl-containing protein [Bacteroidales bacterium]
MKEYKYKINGNTYNVSINEVEENIANVEVNGTPYKVEMDKPVKAAPVKISRPAPEKPAVSVAAPRPVAGKGSIKSPLPGLIFDIKVKVGDVVKRGQTVIILEAMKMENNINAPKDGKIVEIKVSKGESVLEGAELIITE